MPQNIDIVLYCAAQRAKNDTDAVGGGIDASGTAGVPGMRPVFTQLGANDDIEIVSDGADARTVTFESRRADGSISTGTKNANGVTAVFVDTIGDASLHVNERMLLISTTPDAARTLTVRRRPGGATICTIPPNETGVVITFYGSAAAAGNVAREEKYFFRNNGADALDQATVTLTADPQSRIKIALEAAKGGTTSIANRKATFGLSLSDDNVVLNVPTGFLAALENIGVVVQEGLLGGDTPFKSTYTLQCAGQSIT